MTVAQPSAVDGQTDGVLMSERTGLSGDGDGEGAGGGVFACGQRQVAGGRCGVGSERG